MESCSGARRGEVCCQALSEREMTNRMTDESWKSGIDGVLIGSGALAAVGGTSPLWWQNVFTSYCRGQRGLSDVVCANPIVTSVAEKCSECDSYGVSFWIPFIVAIVAGLAFVGKLKDALSF